MFRHGKMVDAEELLDQSLWLGSRRDVSTGRNHIYLFKNDGSLWLGSRRDVSTLKFPQLIADLSGRRYGWEAEGMFRPRHRALPVHPPGPSLWLGSRRDVSTENPVPGCFGK